MLSDADTIRDLREELQKKDAEIETLKSRMNRITCVTSTKRGPCGQPAVCVGEDGFAPTCADHECPHSACKVPGEEETRRYVRDLVAAAKLASSFLFSLPSSTKGANPELPPLGKVWVTLRKAIDGEELDHNKDGDFEGVSSEAYERLKHAFAQMQRHKDALFRWWRANSGPKRRMLAQPDKAPMWQDYNNAITHFYECAMDALS